MAVLILSFVFLKCSAASFVLLAVVGLPFSITAGRYPLYVAPCPF